MSNQENWKDRAYRGYVSSGQAGAGENVNLLQPFKSRAPYIHALIKKHISPDRNQTIVDLGCGSGAYLYFLQQQGYQAVGGVDVSAEQVERAHSIGLLNVEFGAIEDYLDRLSDDSINVILLMDVLEHLDRQEIFSLLDSIHRVLKPGGKCLLHVPNAEGLFGFRVRYGDITHEMAFTPKSIHQILTLTGFDTIQCFADKPVIHNWKSAIRRLIVESALLLPYLYLIAETGQTRFVLSQNMLVSAHKGRTK